MIDKVGGIILKDKKILVERKNNNKEELKEEQKYNYLRSTVEMLEQTLQIV